MKKLIQKIREKKGFTLAELLIVVAIIAVLVAIAIPIFTTQLEKSREGTDLSNIRSVYAEAALAVLDGKTGDVGNSSVSGGTISVAKSGEDWVVSVANFPINQTATGWVVDTSNIAGYTTLGTDWTPTNASSPYTVKFTIDKDGKLKKIGV